MTTTVTSLHRYPVKSMRGESLTSAVVEPWGLEGDRRWMVVEADGPRAGTFVSARRDPGLLLLDPLVTDAGIVLRSPDDRLPPLAVTAPETDHREVHIWGSAVPAATAPAAEAWLSGAVGRPVRLAYLDDPTARPTDPERSEPGDRVSFADGYPLLLTTEASLAALNDALLEGSEGAEDPVAMDRFRSNVVVDGTAPWAEDDWRRVRIGEVTFRMVKGCARCVLTTVDPRTGERGREPMRTLARTRRFDGGVWFGVNLVPDGGAPYVGRLAVGDEVTVLEAAPARGGPLR